MSNYCKIRERVKIPIEEYKQISIESVKILKSNSSLLKEYQQHLDIFLNYAKILNIKPKYSEELKNDSYFKHGLLFIERYKTLIEVVEDIYEDMINAEKLDYLFKRNGKHFLSPEIFKEESLEKDIVLDNLILINKEILHFLRLIKDFNNILEIEMKNNDYKKQKEIIRNITNIKNVNGNVIINNTK